MIGVAVFAGGVVLELLALTLFCNPYPSQRKLDELRRKHGL